MSSWLIYSFVAVGILVLLDLMVHVIYSVSALNRFETLPRLQVAPPPVDAAEPERIRFRTSHQLELAGNLYHPESSPRGVVLFCPETGGCGETAMNYAGALLDHGFVVMSFNFRNDAPSDSMPGYRPNYWITNYEVQDALAAIDFIESDPELRDLPLGLMGVSRGAGTALAAAALRPEVSRVWAQGAFSNWQLVCYHSAKFLKVALGNLSWLVPQWHVRLTMIFMLRWIRIRNGGKLVHLERLLHQLAGRRCLFVSGSRDTYVPGEISQALISRAGRSAEFERWVVAKANHNSERIVAQEEYDDRLVQFFEGMMASTNVPSKAKSRVAS